jgi:transcriptional regulator with XRE-family HTH domain
MAESFGAKLRRQREERQIDLIAIAEQTKIKFALLEALECDDVSHWPSGIFRRAYIRTYAQFIGLDPDAVVREFLELYPDPGHEFAALTAAATAEQAARKDGPPPTRLRTMVDSAIESLARLRRPVTNDVPVPQPVAARTTVSAPAPVAVDLPAVPAAVDPSQPVEPAPPAEPSQAVVIRAEEEPLYDELREPECVEAVSPAVPSANVQPTNESMLETLSRLCTEFGRVAEANDVPELLKDSADALDVTGIIVWVWDELVDGLRPALVYGYSDRVRAHLPTVSRDADNATAAAFRSATSCEVPATSHTSGALVLPLLVPNECAGVLAIELGQGVQVTSMVRAAAAILAAALAQLVHRSRALERQPQGDSHPLAVAHRRPAGPPPFRRIRTHSRRTLRG